MTRKFIDRPKRHMARHGVVKQYKARNGTNLNTVPSTPDKIIIIKERTTNRVVGNSNNVDVMKLRQGVEITDPMQRMRGVVDISCGSDDHIHEQLTLGQSWEHEGNNYFNDNNQQFELIIKNLVTPGNNSSEKKLTFYKIHFSGSDGYGLNVNIRETAQNLYDIQSLNNGSIKIFNEESMFSTNITEYDVSPRKPPNNRIIKQTSVSSQFSNKEINSSPFTDQFPHTLNVQQSIISGMQKPLKNTEVKRGTLNIRDGDNNIKLISSNTAVLSYSNKIIKPNTFYVTEEAQEFFDDSAIVHKTTRLSDNMNNLMANTMLIMSGTGDTDDYVADNMKSAPTGFAFDNATFGTDSIAFR